MRGKMNCRPLRADEIELRIGNITDKGASFLLYKNARTDMTVLDEMVGSGNWQRDHKEIKGNLYCGIGIRASALVEAENTPAQYFDSWVWKWDCGTESNTEKEKGEASDSFKRAGFNWGIGRELYSSPRIFFKTGTKPKQNGKGYELANPFDFWGIYVKEFETIELDSKRVINHLVINQKVQGKDYEVFRWDL